MKVVVKPELVLRSEYWRFRVFEKDVRKMSSPTKAILAGLMGCMGRALDMTGSPPARGSHR